MALTDYTGLRLRGLPFSSKKEDVTFFFSDYSIIPESVKIGRTPDNLKTGEAACLFKDEIECKKAFNERQGKNIGHRWIELY